MSHIVLRVLFLKNVVKKNDTVVLIDSNLKKFIISTDQKTDKIKGVGVIDPSIFIGKERGKNLFSCKFITDI